MLLYVVCIERCYNALMSQTVRAEASMMTLVHSHQLTTVAVEVIHEWAWFKTCSVDDTKENESVFRKKKAFSLPLPQFLR